jgi:hypothetical protein
MAACTGDWQLERNSSQGEFAKRQKGDGRKKYKNTKKHLTYFSHVLG